MLTSTITPVLPDLTWHEFWGEVSVLQAAGWIVGIFALIFFVSKAWPFIRNFFNILDALTTLPAFIKKANDGLDRVNKVEEKINEIHHEVQYNNGSSVKDAISRVEKGVAGLHVKVGELDRADQELDRRLQDTIPSPPWVGYRRSTGADNDPVGPQDLMD